MTLAIRPAPASAPVRYVGLATRTLAFALDALLINAVSLLCTAAVALAVSILTLPGDVTNVLAAVGGVAYVAWVIGYFVSFWSTTGQTPGSRALRLRVLDADSGRPIATRIALWRWVALWLAMLPFGAGLLTILVDDRRRGLHDRLAGTVVVDAPRPGDAA